MSGLGWKTTRPFQAWVILPTASVQGQMRASLLLIAITLLMCVCCGLEWVCMPKSGSTSYSAAHMQCSTRQRMAGTGYVAATRLTPGRWRRTNYKARQCQLRFVGKDQGQVRKWLEPLRLGSGQVSLGLKCRPQKTSSQTKPNSGQLFFHLKALICEVIHSSVLCLILFNIYMKPLGEQYIDNTNLLYFKY